MYSKWRVALPRTDVEVTRRLNKFTINMTWVSVRQSPQSTWCGILFGLGLGSCLFQKQDLR